MNGRPFTAEEDLEIVRLRAIGTPIRQMQVKLGRSASMISQRIAHLRSKGVDVPPARSGNPNHKINVAEGFGKRSAALRDAMEAVFVSTARRHRLDYLTARTLLMDGFEAARREVAA